VICFRRLALAALIVLGSVSSAAATPYANGLFDLTWRKLAEGVWVGQRPDPMRYPVVANSVIVVGDDGVLIFDGGGFPAQGEQVLAKVKTLTPLPVKYVVISHWHGDHNRGIFPILEAFPNAEVVGHSFTRAAMLGAPMQSIHKSEQAGEVKAIGDEVKQSLIQNKFIDGTPLKEGERAFFERFVADNVAHQAEVMRMRITPPSKTFDTDLTIRLGHRVIELRHFGPANTKGDAVMILPAERIIAAGDIVVEPIPYGFGSYPANWAKALKDLKAIGFKTLIPGHGALQTDTRYVDLLIEALDSVTRQVDAALADGKSPADVTKLVDFSAVEPRFTKGDPILTRFFDLYFKQPIVPAAYNVAKGIENEKLTEDPPKPN
jgi:glyoxylase-like metal-dependent hydrolase (beta-lactamase superfamily II)